MISGWPLYSFISPYTRTVLPLKYSFGERSIYLDAAGTLFLYMIALKLSLNFNINSLSARYVSMTFASIILTLPIFVFAWLVDILPFSESRSAHSPLLFSLASFCASKNFSVYFRLGGYV